MLCRGKRSREELAPPADVPRKKPFSAPEKPSPAASSVLGQKARPRPSEPGKPGLLLIKCSFACHDRFYCADGSVDGPERSTKRAHVADPPSHAGEKKRPPEIQPADLQDETAGEAAARKRPRQATGRLMAPSPLSQPIQLPHVLSWGGMHLRPWHAGCTPCCNVGGGLQGGHWGAWRPQSCSLLR